MMLAFSWGLERGVPGVIPGCVPRLAYRIAPCGGAVQLEGKPTLTLSRRKPVS